MRLGLRPGLLKERVRLGLRLDFPKDSKIRFEARSTERVRLGLRRDLLKGRVRLGLRPDLLKE